MHGTPRWAPRPHDGRAYDCSRICRWLRSMFLPTDCVMVQVSPLSREMNNCRPPTRTVEELCGEKRIGEFQLNCETKSAAGCAGLFTTLLRPPPKLAG